MKLRDARRTGFTLLEVLLASLIAILLMAALYFAMDITLRQTQESRDGVDVENLSRGVFTRMNQDLSASLGPLPPKSGGNAAASTAAAPAADPTADPTMMATADPTMTATTPSATATPATATPPSATTSADPAAAPAVDPETGEAVATPQAADVGFQAGIVGDESYITVFASRLPSAMTSARGLSDTGGIQQPSDLVRITYWVRQGGGLCRQVRPWVTADGVRNSTDPDYSDEASDTLVQEVSEATFGYFDPGLGDFVSSWDGTQMSPDGVTPIGPPRAVKVTLVYEVPASHRGDPPIRHTVVQVIPVRAAPGSYTPEMITPSTDPGTTTPDSGSGSGTSGGAGGAGGGTGAGAGGAGGGTGTGTGAGGGAGGAGGGARPSTGGGATPSTGGGARPTTSTPSTGGSRPATSTPSTGGARPTAGGSGAGGGTRTGGGR